MGRHDHKRAPVVGERLGCFEVIGEAPQLPHHGVQVRVRCTLCSLEYVKLQTQIRSRPPRAHRGCKANRGVRGRRIDRLTEASIESAGVRTQRNAMMREVDGASGEWSTADVPQRKLWDMSRKETRTRLGAAVDNVWRAYMQASSARANMPQWKDPLFVAAYERIDAELATIGGAS